MGIRFEELIGKVFSAVHPNSDKLTFVLADGSGEYVQYHRQDCCESVSIEDINGDLEDLINTPILEAEEVTQADPNASESGTWTFYKLRTAKGYAAIRWYGSSNGYYSESVDTEFKPSRETKKLQEALNLAVEKYHDTGEHWNNGEVEAYFDALRAQNPNFAQFINIVEEKLGDINYTLASHYEEKDHATKAELAQEAEKMGENLYALIKKI